MGILDALLGRKHPPLIGLDISSSSVKLVELSQTKSGEFVLERFASEPFEKGWIAELKVYAVLHNHAGVYHPDFNAPTMKVANTGWASGAWFIGPDGKTLAQMPSSTQKSDSKENVLIYSVPIP